MNTYSLGEAHLEIKDDGSYIVHIYPESCNDGERGLCHLMDMYINTTGETPIVKLHLGHENESATSDNRNN